MKYDDISYDSHAELLYKLAGKMVTHLRSYLPDEDAVENVLQSYNRQLAELIHTQMQSHYWESPVDRVVHVSKGFITLGENNFTVTTGEKARNFREPVEDKQYIRGLYFTEFNHCLYRSQKFDTDTERRFAILLEDDKEVLKWFKPINGQFRIDYRFNGDDHEYIPDFAVETHSEKYLCETKRASDMKDSEVLAKASAAVEWCKHATAHELANGDKPWSYLLIPHDEITADKTLQGLAAAYNNKDISRHTTL